MDKLSRFVLGLEEAGDVEIEEMSFTLGDFFSNESDEERVAVGYKDDDEDDEDGEPKQDYNAEFRLSMPEIYKGHAEKARKDGNNHESIYNNSDEMVFDERAGLRTERPEEDKSPWLDSDLLLTPESDLEYGEAAVHTYSEDMMKGSATERYQSGLLSIEYDTPELINGQETYQRIVFEADAEGETVYEMTMRKFMDAGMETSSSYDPEFDTMIFTSINQRKEGVDGNFNEFYLNGGIGDNAVDKERLKKGDVVEWRYAEESDGSCGGVPDFHRIKNMLQQYKGSGPGNTYGGPQEMNIINPRSNPHLLLAY
jgi:hypothetical protein